MGENFTCNICGCIILSSLSNYCSHVALHSQNANSYFKCPKSDCIAQYKDFSALKNHCYKVHKDNFGKIPKNFRICVPDEVFICKYEACRKHFRTANEIFKHSIVHIDEFIAIQCPFKDCNNIFETDKRTKSKFRCHVSTYHKGILKGPKTTENEESSSFDNTLNDTMTDCSDTFEEDGEPETQILEECQITQQLDDAKFEIEIVHQIAKFYLRLESVAHVAATNVQKIYDSWVTFTELDLEHRVTKLEQLLKNHLPDSTTLSKIIHDYKSSDIIYIVHHPKEFPDKGFPNLSTDYLRKKYFKENFDYIEPTNVYIGKSKKGKEQFCHYVPIEETLTNFLGKDENKCILRPKKSNTQQSTGNKIFKDYTEGIVFKKNAISFPEQTADCGIDTNIDLILYTDDWNPVDALAAARNKQKITSFYLMIGNIVPEHRFDLDKIFVLILSKTAYLKHDGLNVALAPLIEDIKRISATGLKIGGIHFNFNLAYLMADNLGAHFIGGFQCCFSRGYICRYCDITYDTFTSFKDEVFKQFGENRRTPQSYEDDLNSMEVNGKPIFKGIKSNCLFNDVGDFHCCMPALPPCLAHDLYEGVLDYDIGIYITYFIEKKYFTLENLNKAIECFEYKENDATNKPKLLLDNFKRLGGSASQNRTFLRLLPFLVGPFIEDLDDEVWINALRLRRICEYACAPAISMTQINIFKGCIDEYIFYRKTLFSTMRLRPKHHFMLHYPELIIELGPLVRHMTLRQESKHSELKQVLVKSKNYINPTKMLASRHQLYLALKNSEKLVHDKIEFRRMPQPVKDVMSDYNLTGLVTERHKNFFFITDSIKYKGNLVTPSHWVFLGCINSVPCIGKILFVLVNSENDIELCVEVKHYAYEHNTGLIYVKNEMVDRKIIKIVASGLL